MGERGPQGAVAECPCGALRRRSATKMKEKITALIEESLKALGVEAPKVSVEHPDNLSRGDYSTNAALLCARRFGAAPRELAERIARHVRGNQPPEISEVEAVSPGFVNFRLSPRFLAARVGEILRQDGRFGTGSSLAGKKVLVEYTDPNAFKPFHIGHLMSNAIGEAISRLVESRGAEVVRICYPSDVGLHIAKAVWAALRHIDKLPAESDPITVRTAFLGAAYAEGTAAYEADRQAREEMDAINKKLFERSDKRINEMYDTGRRWSFEHFDEIYRKVGTAFDVTIAESEVARSGEAIVKDFLAKGVFEQSGGAIVFKGEKHGLHTRVFITAKGLPTYEAKELGLNAKKFELFPDAAQSIIITASEQDDYFKVLRLVLEIIRPDIGKKTKHIGHGMLRLPTGKMSSRTGNVITGESLIAAVEAMVHQKLEGRELLTSEKNKIADEVAIAAIKYSILRQAIGGDIVYDFEKSISFEGDSGPYLAYSYVRARSVAGKAAEAGIVPDASLPADERVGALEQLLHRFPEIAARAGREYAPHHVAVYLTELAGVFNSYYAENKIIAAGESAPYRAALSQAFAVVMRNGLNLLGIPVPEKM